MAPRVLIFGTGSIGACYAFIISRAIPSNDLVTVCRSNYDAASKDGFTINSTKWGVGQKVRPVVVRSVSDAVALNPKTPFDFIIVCSKAIASTPSTAELISPAVSTNTTIVLIQNGIATEEPFTKLFPQNSLLSTVVYLPANQTSPGVIEHKEMELLHIGSYPSSTDTESATRFSDLIRAGGGCTLVHEDVQFERWSKLLVNAWNPICALTRSHDAYFLRSDPDAINLVRELMLELAAVASACGYPGIDAELAELQLKRATVREPPGVEPSMMSDALAGRNMEVEAIAGNVFRLGREKGIDTPLLKSVYLLAKALDGSFTRLRQ